MKLNIWFWAAATLIIAGLIALITPIGSRSTPVLYVLLPVGAVFAGMFLVSGLMGGNETAAESAPSAVPKTGKQVIQSKVTGA